MNNDGSQESPSQKEGVTESGVTESGVWLTPRCAGVQEEERRKKKEERRKKNLEPELLSPNYLKLLTLSLRFCPKNIYQHHY